MSAVHCMSPMNQPVEPKTELHDDELIRRYQSGDISAFGSLVARHDRKVLTIATRYTHSPEDAKDIYQEVFYRVYRGLGGFRFRSEFSTWLYRITVNVCIMYRALRQRDLHLSLDSAGVEESNPPLNKSGETGIDVLRRNEINGRIASAVETLSPKQRMVFVLKHYEGQKIREIAEFMNCTEGTVKKYLFTAIERLRGELQDIV